MRSYYHSNTPEKLDVRSKFIFDTTVRKISGLEFKDEIDCSDHVISFDQFEEPFSFKCNDLKKENFHTILQFNNKIVIVNNVADQEILIDLLSKKEFPVIYHILLQYYQ